MKIASSSPAALPPDPEPTSSPPSGVRRCSPAPDDVRAFLALVRRQPARWRNRIPRRVFEDLFQNAMVRMLENEDSIAPESRGAWFRKALLHEKLHSIEDDARRKEHAPQLEVHLREHAAALPMPDGAVEQRDLLEAVGWLLEQVEPERRAACGWCILRALDEDAVGLDAVAEGLGIERGTLGSQWARGKEDMEAALRRERAKPRGKSKLAALFALLASLWFWLVRRGGVAHASVPGSEPAGRDITDPESPPDRDGSVRSRRNVGLAALVGVLLSFVLLSHEALDHAASPRVGQLAGEPAAALLEGATDIEVEDRHDGDRIRFAPFLTTNAERERESGVDGDADPRTSALVSRRRASPDVTATPERRGVEARELRPERTAVTAATAPSSARLEAARAHLMAVHRALWVHRDRGEARQWLETYELTFPEDPFPAKHAELSAALRAP